MTEQQPPDEGESIPIDQTDRRSLAPFVAAAVVAGIVLVAIVLGGVLAPAEKNVTEADRVSAAVRNFVEGTNSSDLVPPPGTGCADFDPERSPLAGQEGSGKTIQVKNIAAPAIDGEKATVSVTTDVEGAERTATWNLIRADGKWLVCTV
ncbi:hypothetical protein IU433_06205 [Nocardia puris]|uniref:Lumazine-binding protein n=1 Tax=Nocardia puris TaxID=208602 RepID=A0A366DCU2_9NOCA|nr:hypothetical protein [Nocardia puris]MBF6211125.1 hypothetical protein [Nocardia puris]MBF6364844.1 hypothetical protein [Nocardia puris]MBF6458630.1 hypothetical protein [Nocardia puris]RBO87871.1 hypothetical protein DFR74_110126 [Nocardia puris]